MVLLFSPDNGVDFSHRFHTRWPNPRPRIAADRKNRLSNSEGGGASSTLARSHSVSTSDAVDQLLQAAQGFDHTPGAELGAAVVASAAFAPAAPPGDTAVVPAAVVTGAGAMPGRVSEACGALPA